MAYFQAVLLIACLSSAHSTETTCKPEGLANCTCHKLIDSTVFVDCSGGNLRIQDACRLCNSIENVTEIDLSFNSLSDIPETCFKHCRSVNTLSLVSNRIRTLKKNTFTCMKQLQQLNLDRNILIQDGNISTPEAFDSLVNLQSLSLKGNVGSQKGTEAYEYLANISNKTFTELRKLFLDGLPYGSFGQNFQNYKNLAYIDFSGIDGTCKILGLTSESFRNVIYVTHLNLSKCQISTIDAGTFEPLSRLRNLNLSHNMELGFVTLRNVTYGLQNTSIEVLDYSKVYKPLEQQIS